MLQISRDTNWRTTYAGQTISKTVGRGTLSWRLIDESDGNVTLWNKASIEVLPGSSLTMHVRGSLSITKRTAVDGTNILRVKFIMLSSNPVTLDSACNAQAVIVAPNSAVQISNGFDLYGAVLAKSLNIFGGAGVHEDLRITGKVDQVTLPGNGQPRIDTGSRMVQ